MLLIDSVSFPRCVMAVDRCRLLPMQLPVALLCWSVIAAEEKRLLTLSGNRANSYAATLARAVFFVALHAAVGTTHMAIRLFSSRIVSLSFFILHCHKKCTIDTNQLRKSHKVHGPSAALPATAVRENAFNMLIPIETFLSNRH